MKVIFFDYVGALTLLCNVAEFKKYQEVYYIDISLSAEKLLKYCRLDKRVMRLNFAIYDLRDENGESSIKRIFGKDLTNLCDKVRHNIFEKDSFIAALAKMFGTEKTIFFFRKLSASELHQVNILLNAIRCKCRLYQKSKDVSVDFSIERDIYFEEIKRFAHDEFGIRVIPAFSFRNRLKALGILAKNTITLIWTCISSLGSVFTGGFLRKNVTSRVGVAYRYCGMNFDKIKRCDFSWLLFSGIPYEKVILYFDNKHGRVPERDEIMALKSIKGINYFTTYSNEVFSGNIPIYRCSLRSCVKIAALTLKILPALLKEIAQLRSSVIYSLSKALNLINLYSRAYDFYKSNNIKINVDRDYTDPYLIAEEAALRDVGGISVCYQQANPPWPHVQYSTCADVVFVFGPYYHKLISSSSSKNKAVVYTGFLSDYAIEGVKSNSERIREELIRHGAKYIITYFDENSYDGKLSPITNAKSEQIYRKYLELLLSEGDIGIIFSPKDPHTLMKRISGAAELMEKAKATGRCVLMGGRVRTFSWPTEAAQASDLAIGSLEGGTTVLESVLSGVKSVYLDLLGLYSFPEYRLGKDVIVFDDIDKLISKIRECKDRPDRSEHFGDMSILGDIITSKDPFRDGRAAERMGTYIRWLLEGLDSGKTAKEAIGTASRRYASAWGEKNIAVER